MKDQQIPIGHIIKQKLKEQGRTAAWLARQIPCSSNHIFKIFRKYTLSTDLLQRISRILDYNFFQHFE
ncbi:MAG: helix-turn-helix transcriptional regulator [Bacteroidales bacterium]|nr:helix-turn-helix transcriptional regulator [Bacteroidales bacterium]